MPPRMCCIEPSATLRLLLVEMAHKAGWEADACKDLEEAEELFDNGEKPIDLIVTAANLPSGSYHGVLARSRGCSETDTVPVVLLTSDAEVGQIDRALESGVTEVFLKHDLDAFEIYLDSHADNGAIDLVGKCVLVLDDDHAVGEYLKAVLAEIGLRVDLLHELDDALSEALVKHYDLVITDLVLDHNRSGVGFIRLLRQSSGKSANSPVIAVSGYVDDARRIEALRAGADAFLAKPIIASELCFQTQRLLQRPAAGENNASSTAVLDSTLAKNLSEREQLVCALVAAGHRDKEIARQIGISYWTVRSYLARIFKKSGATNRIDLAVKVHQKAGASPLPVIGQPGTAADAINWLHMSAYMLNEIGQAVMFTDKDGAILHVNSAFTEITGFHSDEVVGKTPRQLSSGRQSPDFYLKMFEDLKKRGTWSGEICERGKNGNDFTAWFDFRRLPAHAPMGAHYVALITYADSKVAQYETFRYAALHDPLTGLANRTLLEDRVSLEIARAKRNGKRIGIAFVDLDRFKIINDTLGHLYGGGVLKEVAHRLSSVLRTHDTLARQGGDEFVVVLTDIDNGDIAQALGHKLLGVFRAPHSLPDGGSLQLGASIGISLYPDDGAVFEELLGRADMAMYRAKHTGGGKVQCYDPSIEALALEVVDLDSVIAAHRDWRYRFEEAINGIDASKLNDLHIEDYDQCNLGKWLKANTQLRRYDGLIHFQQASDCHIEFRQIAKRIVDNLQTSRVEEALQLLQSRFIETSDNLVGKLEELKGHPKI